jgi:hypothetical protein
MNAEGQPQGNGVYTFADELTFEGEWKDNCFLTETIYDKDYDYTVESWLEVACK